MKRVAHMLFGTICAWSALTFPAPANAIEDQRITYYKNEVHGQADQLRARSRDLVAWQKNNWVAPRVCNGSVLSWARVPAGKSAELYDCAPFQCSNDGFCRQECSTDGDCASGARCLDKDASGRNGVCAAR